MAERDNEHWQVADLTIDVGGRSVVRGDQAIILPKLSFKFLLALVHASPDVLSADELMERVWTGIFVNSETVTQRAKLLRDALSDDPKEPRYFTVRRGVGYQLIPAPIRIDPSDNAASNPAHVRNGRWMLVLAAIALGAASIGGIAAMKVWPFDARSAMPASIRVAVLPFDNLSSDPADEFIARSIPEMVLNRLSSMPGLLVISRESALLSSAASASPKDAGAQLKAGYVVRGSVQRIAGMLRVTCFVVDTAQGARLWSERFDWPIDRLYALQDRIADRVASSLEARTRGLGELAPATIAPRNTDAYLAYLKGKSLLGRFTVAQTDSAAAQFERAVKLDPEFAPALVALFDARMQGADLRKDDLGPTREHYQPLLDKALRLDPGSGEAMFAKAMWSGSPQAERLALFRRAAELDPSNSRGLAAFAEFFEWDNVTRDGGPGGEGQRLMDRVLSIDPLSPRARFWAVQRQLGQLTPEQLEREQARALQVDPENYLLANRYAYRRWMFHGETAEAIEMMEKVIASDPQNPLGPQLAFAFYLDVDDPAAARAIAATTPATRDSSRTLLAQFAGDWRGAGLAALGHRGFLFNKYSNWNWAEAVRDLALQTKEYDQAAGAIASHYGFDLRNPRTTNLPQATVAPALGHILLAAGQREQGTRLLTQTVQWIDGHPRYGLVGVRRLRATAMMLLGERDQALSDLRASIETGHDIRHWWYIIDRDPVWAPVRNDPRFKAITEMCRNAASVQRAKLDALRRAGKVPARHELTNS
ncbi:MAG: winged helix-turn-helix domain-containing protein [Novosphingobium sp.]